MNSVSVRGLFQICLMIAGLSPTNLTMNSYFIKKTISEKLDDIVFNKDLTVDEIVSTPQRNNDPGNFYDEEVNVAIMNNKAYWIKDNNIYTSNINEFGDIDIKNAKTIDVFSLSNSEAKLLLKIVDNLNLD